MKTNIWILALVAVGAMTPAAHGQGVITTTLPTPMGMSSDLFTILYPIDMNGDSVVDFTFGAETSGIALRTERANRLIYRIAPPNIGGLVADLPEGYVVGSSLEPQLGWIPSDPAEGYVSPGEIAFATIAISLSTGVGIISSASDWPSGPPTRGFIGLEFELPDGLHYGYFDIMVSGDGAGGSLLGWAYDTRPNIPIFATAVPEPSALALFAVAGIAMLALRRR
jgi:hypothetical protein